ncbi:deoxynucleoside kinase, partial [bacterium]|nr:deoxynucleoside kinase [bacterium]
MAFHVDALLTPFVLSNQRSRSVSIQDIVQRMLDVRTYRDSVAKRLVLRHLSGTSNLPSDLASRGLWEELAHLCEALRVRPVMVRLDDVETTLLLGVVEAAAERSGHAFDASVLQSGILTEAPVPMQSRSVDETNAWRHTTDAQQCGRWSHSGDMWRRYRDERGESSEAPLVSNKRVRAASKHSTSINLKDAADSVAQQDFSMADMSAITMVEAEPLRCLICLEGDEGGAVLFLRCCDQPLHAACFRRHVAAMAYQDPGSDEEVATLSRTKVRCPVCNVGLRCTSIKGVLQSLPSVQVTLNHPSLPPSPPATPTQANIREVVQPFGPVHISIEGAVGAGKTTLLRRLETLYASKAVVFVPEPVDLWLSTGMLRRFYSHEMSALEFQLAAFTTLYATFARAMTTPGVKVVVTERSLRSNLEVFATLNLSGDALADFTTVFDALESTLAKHREIMVYLQTTPACLCERVAERGREEEAGLGLSFHARMVAAHDAMCARHAHVICIDANSSGDDVVMQATRNLANLLSPQARDATLPRSRLRNVLRWLSERCSHFINNLWIRATSKHSTSVHLGLAADSVAQADYDMASVPSEHISDATTVVRPNLHGRPGLYAARRIWRGEMVAIFGRGAAMRVQHWDAYCHARELP